MGDEIYCYPPTYTVLRNLADLQDQDDLDRFERNAVRVRASEPLPTGDFDLKHLQAIHHHLFQDVYAWAGAIREVEIAKGGDQFQPRRFIETGMADIHTRLVEMDFLQKGSPDAFAEAAGPIMGDVNYVHPFREGNGRTQLLYLRQLAAQAGHTLDLSRITRETWIAASIAAHQGEYDLMSRAISAALSHEPTPSRADPTDAMARRYKAYKTRQRGQREELDQDIEPEQ